MKIHVVFLETATMCILANGYQRFGGGKWLSLMGKVYDPTVNKPQE